MNRRRRLCGAYSSSQIAVPTPSGTEPLPDVATRTGGFVSSTVGCPGVSPVEVGVGVAYQRIVEKSAAEGVDLIVMSTHGRTGFLHVLIGSVTEKVVRMAACPVLSVRPAKEAVPAKAAA